MIIFSKHFREPCFWPGHPPFIREVYVTVCIKSNTNKLNFCKCRVHRGVCMLYLSECPVISNKELESIIFIAAVVEDREEREGALHLNATVILSLIYAKSH